MDEIWEQKTEEYFLHVTAKHIDTGDNDSLIGAFRVFGHQEKYFCSLNMINTGTRPIPQGESLEFISVGKAKDIICKIDGIMQPCKLIFAMIVIMCVKSLSVLCNGKN